MSTYPPCPWCRPARLATAKLDGLFACPECVDRVVKVRRNGALAALGVRFVEPSVLERRGHRLPNLNPPPDPDPIGVTAGKQEAK